jgi:hypothetical protein
VLIVRVERANCSKAIGRGPSKGGELAKCVFELRGEQAGCRKEVVEEQGAVFGEGVVRGLCVPAGVAGRDLPFGRQERGQIGTQHE